MDYIKEYVSYIKDVKNSIRLFPDTLKLDDFYEEIRYKQIDILKEICLIPDNEIENAYIKSQLLFNNLDLVAKSEYGNMCCVGDGWKLKDSRDVIMLSRAISNVLYAPWVMSYLRNDKEYQDRYKDSVIKWDPIRSYILKLPTYENFKFIYGSCYKIFIIRDIGLCHTFDYKKYYLRMMISGGNAHYIVKDLESNETNYNEILNSICEILRNKEYCINLEE